jgi:cysteine synthase A
VDLALEKLDEIRSANTDDYWVPAQFDNLDNNEAHYLTTGPEIWDQLDSKVDAVIASQGTGGWVSGAGKFIREQNPEALLYAVEPEECPLLSQRGWGPHGIEGIGDGFVPRALDLSLLSGIVTTTTGESIEMAQRLAREEGIFCGISSGCNVAAAVKLARAHPELETIVTNINDTGQRYFTTALCGEEKHVDIPDRDHEVDPYSAGELAKYAGSWEIIG